MLCYQRELACERVFGVGWFWGWSGAIASANAQRKIDPGHNHERVLAMVPMTGTGTAADPRRPLHAPVKADPNGILSFSYQVSDDGRFAIVEYVARNRAALAPVLAANQPNVKAFEKEKASRAELETEFKKYKKDFDLDSFQRVKR